MRVHLIVILLLAPCLSLLGSCFEHNHGPDVESTLFHMLAADPGLKHEGIVLRLAESRSGTVLIKMVAGDHALREKLNQLNPTFPSRNGLPQILDTPPALVPALEALQKAVDATLQVKGVKRVRLSGLVNTLMDQAEALCQRKQYPEAIMLYSQAAEEGLAEAQYRLGIFYLAGKAVPRNAVKATDWLEKAALQDHAEAMHTLGVIYQYGLDVSPDLAKARSCYERAAELGLRQSQVNLAQMYEHGWGVERLPDKAREMLEAAADEGDAYALTNLGLMYERGEGVCRSYARALDYYRKAAAHESMLGYSALAWLLATCASPEFRDPRKALDYAEKAVELAGQDPDNAWMAWDSAAAAHAGAGRFDHATEDAERAIALLQESRTIMEPERQRELGDARARLELYRQRQSYITPTNESR